jgi:glycosyltransferase involved in cell wall biosynthesis
MNSDFNQSISVVIPTMGGRAEYLRQAIECVALQSLLPSEVIIVNNGEDSLIDFEYPQGLSFPLIVLNTVFKAGASQARNLGATVAKGKMIAFLDDDDLWAGNYLEEMLKVVLSEGSNCVVSRIAKLQNNEVSNLFDVSNYLTQRFFLVMNPGVTGSNLIIDKKLFLSIGGYDCKLQTGEDGDLILKVLDSGGRIAMCDTTKAVMRVHNGDRLTDSASLSSGYRSLYLKYKSRVGVRDKIYLYWRYKREVYRANKNFISFFSMLFLSAVVVLIHRTPKSIYVMKD